MVSRKKRNSRTVKEKPPIGPPAVATRTVPSRPLPWRMILVVVLVVIGATTFKIIVSNRNNSVAVDPLPATGRSNEQGRTVDRPKSQQTKPEPDQIALGSIPAGPLSEADKLTELIDPSKDQGWETEVLNEAAGSQLKSLAKLIVQPSLIDLKHLGPLAADSFACGFLRPEQTELVLGDKSLNVRRAVANPPTEQQTPPQFHGPEGLGEALQLLASMLRQSPQAHCKLKLFKIEKSKDFFTTRQYFQASDHTARQGTQINAVWKCRWTYPEDQPQSQPRLLSIEVDRFEEIATNADSGRQFEDCTFSALKSNNRYQSQELPGLNHWVTRISRLDDLSLFGYHGIAVGDVNGDDLEDLYVCDDGGLPNRLYVQQPDGKLREVSQESGVDWLDSSSAALLVDLDNDGDQDLAIAARPRLIVMENDGQGHFELRDGDHPLSSPTSLCAADYNNDGNIDLFVCSYLPDPQSRLLPLPVPYQDANNGGPNLLLAGDGKFRFRDVTAKSGIAHNNTRFSFAASWEDFDNDGDQDLYVANDFGRNNLYRNDQGHFSDVAAEAQAEDIASGMSVAWGDYNRDGRPDLYVSNMFSAAGNRITYQRSYSSQGLGETVKHIQRMARGNTLFSAKENNTFEDVSEQLAVNMGRWAWSSQFADLNNDGWQDLLVANGYVTGEDSKDL